MICLPGAVGSVFASFIPRRPSKFSDVRVALLAPARAYRQWEEIPLGLRMYLQVLILLIPVYVAIPFDIFPEAILGPFGLLDDFFMGILLIFLVSIVSIFPDYLRVYALKRFTVRDTNFGALLH